MIRTNILNYTKYTDAHTGCYAVCDVVDHFTKGLTVKKYGRRSEPDFKSVDLNIINGEGTLHHNSSFFPSLLRSEMKTSVLINTVWDNQVMTGIDWELMNKKVLFVSCRETLSAEQLRKSPFNGEVIVVPDLTFYKEIDILNIERKGLAYSDSFFHQVSKLNSLQPHYLPIASSPPVTWENYASWLQQFETFYTGRFHGLCLAISTNTPFVFQGANTHKGKGLIMDRGDTPTDVFVGRAKEAIEKLWQKVFSL